MEKNLADGMHQRTIDTQASIIQSMMARFATIAAMAENGEHGIAKLAREAAGMAAAPAKPEPAVQGRSPKLPPAFAVLWAGNYWSFSDYLDGNAHLIANVYSAAQMDAHAQAAVRLAAPVARPLAPSGAVTDAAVKLLQEVRYLDDHCEIAPVASITRDFENLAERITKFLDAAPSPVNPKQ